MHTVEEVAMRLGLSAYQVRGMIKAGELRAVKICGRWRIPSESLEALTGKLQPAKR